MYSLPNFRSFKLKAQCKGMSDIEYMRHNLIPGNKYLVLGVTGMDDYLVVVNKLKGVVEVPFHEDDWILEE